MVILFKTGRLEKECNSEGLMVRRLGPHRAGLLKRRLTELDAAVTLDDMRRLPQARCHELKGDLRGCLSVDLDHPYRLIIEPANNPVPRKADGGLDWSRITEITVIGIEDTHE